MILIKVSTSKREIEFFEKNWFRRLDADIEGVFTLIPTSFFRNGAKTQRWLVGDEKGETIGR